MRPSEVGVVRVVHGPDASVRDLSLTLDGRSFIVGRTAAISVDDARLSRAHFSLEPASGAGGQYRLSDLGSSNGCFVDGAPVAQTLLSHNDVIRAGDTLLLVDLPAAPGRYPAREDACERSAVEWVGSSFHIPFQGCTG